MIKVDYVVLVKNPAKSRPYWYLGRVLELLEGDDDHVRSVKLRRSDGGRHNHSLKQLYTLELSLTHSHQADNPLDKTDESAVTSVDEPLDLVDPISCGTRPDTRPKRHVRKRLNNENEFLWYYGLVRW